MLKTVYEEVKSLFGTYNRAIEGLDGKASTLFGFAVLIAGVFVGLGSYVVDKVQNQWFNWFITFFVIGAISLICSAVLSLWAYQVKRRALGPDLGFLKEIGKISSKKKALEKLVGKYYECIDENVGVVNSKSKKIKFSLWAVLIGVSVILADVLIFVVIMSLVR